MNRPRLPCPVARWPRFSALLDSLLDLPPGQRAAWLAALPAQDADLRPGLAAVLAGLPQAQAATFLDAPRATPEARHADGDGHSAGRSGAEDGGPVAGGAGRAGPASREEGDAEHHAGQTVGPYALLRELGRGGMGVVWLARRADGAYEQEVALKLPHPHVPGGGLQARFRRERDLLARLTHPHIARFHDAGVDAQGQPYLAMEAVAGLVITEWCRQQRLTLEQRLALFEQVVQAVAHAHSRLVAHRDLKPANVLVTPDGGVKLLDFGIARLLHADTDADTDAARAARADLTQAHGLLATLRYAAPEQLQGGSISAATDVYALGVMLFELLTGQLPPAASSVLPAAESPLTSQRVDAGHAATLGLSSAALSRRLRGDLDAIVAMALQPQAEQRYSTAAALAGDLRAWRLHLPLQAQRNSAWRSGWKFVRRHATGLALGGALLLAVVGGSVGVAVQAQRAAQAAQGAAALKDQLLKLLVGIDPRQAGAQPARQLTVKAALDLQIDALLALPENDAMPADPLLEQAAKIYVYLGEPLRSVQIEQLRVQRLARRSAADAPALLQARQSLVWMLQSAGQLPEAATQLALLHRELAPPRPPGLALAEWTLAQHDQRAQEGAPAGDRLQILHSAQVLYGAHGPLDSGHAATLLNLADWHLQAGQPEQALPWLQQGLALAPRTQPYVASMHARLLAARGRAAQALGRPAAAREDTAAALGLLRQSIGLETPSAWSTAQQMLRLLCPDRGRPPPPDVQAAQLLLAEIPTARQARHPQAASGLRQAAAPCLATLPAANMARVR